MNIIQAPNRTQIRAAAEWLSQCLYPNPDLEYVLHLILMDRLQLNQGELLIILHASPTENHLDPKSICGVLMAGPDNTNVSLAGCDRATTEMLLSFARNRGCLRRIATPILNRDWVRRLLLTEHQLEREYVSLIMECTTAPTAGSGRWAVLDDKPSLDAYIEANQAERGTRIIRHDWDALIQQKRVAVLEHEGQIVSVAKWGETLEHAMIVGMFTFAPFRQQGFAKQLLSFVLRELFQRFSAVKLWVDDDNEQAIALYESLHFQTRGSLYTGYVCVC